MTRLRELKEIAEKATPGPWEQDVDTVWADDCDHHPILGPDYANHTCRSGEQTVANAAHIATFDPPTVLSLLSDLERARSLVTRQSEALADARGVMDTEGFDDDVARIDELDEEARSFLQEQEPSE